MLKAYFDGHSPGKEGNSKWGFVYVNGSNQHKVSEVLGYSSETVVKYFGLIELLKYLKDRKITKVKIYGDSSLVVKQTNGELKCDQEFLQTLCRKATAYLKDSGCTLELIEKSKNLANKLVK